MPPLFPRFALPAPARPFVARLGRAGTQTLIAALLSCAASLLPSNTAAAPALPALIFPEGAGVNIHFTRGHERDLDLIAQAGFRWVRMDFGWGGIERTKGDYNWRDYDELTANLERRHLRPLYILDYSNALYEETVVSKNPTSGKEQRAVASPQHPESIVAFARWAAAAARHFSGRGVIWEIWNEPNISFWKPKPDARQYTTLALATAKAVREADLSSLIIGPASSEFPWPFLETVLSSGLLDYIDAVSVHPYRNYRRGPETAEDDYRRLRALIQQHAPTGKSFPIISGEWGYATHTKGVSLDTQAAFLARQQLCNVLAGVPISIWYDWKNDGPDATEREHNFGIVTSDLAPKPAYTAMRTLTSQLTGYRIVRRIDVSSANDFVLLLADKAGAQKLAAWTTGEPHGINLDADALESAGIRSIVTAINSAGETHRIERTSDGIRFDLEPAPVYVTLARPK